MPARWVKRQRPSTRSPRGGPMLIIAPATLLKPTKAGDQVVPWPGYWEATYTGSPFSCVRSCPLLAAADVLHNVRHFTPRKPHAS
jgi:hypothetical protein